MALPLYASATHIDIRPSTTNTSVGSTFSVDVVISGLNGVSPALAITDYDLDISYNQALLHALGVSFGSGLGSPPDIFGSDLTTTLGVVDFFAVSFASYATLLGLQGDTFTLATLSFQALANGTDSLAFVQNAFFIVDMINADNQNPTNAADPVHCQSLNCIGVGGGRVVIGSNTAPEPAPLLLLGAVALAWVTVRRRENVGNSQAAAS